MGSTVILGIGHQYIYIFLIVQHLLKTILTCCLCSAVGTSAFPGVSRDNPSHFAASPIYQTPTNHSSLSVPRVQLRSWVCVYFASGWPLSTEKYVLLSTDQRSNKHEKNCSWIYGSSDFSFFFSSESLVSCLLHSL